MIFKFMKSNKSACCTERQLTSGKKNKKHFSPFQAGLSLRNNQGQGMVEYLILVALISVSSIAIMRVVGNSVNTQYAKVAKALGASVEGDLSRPTASSATYKKRDLTNFLQGAVGNESRGSSQND